MTLLRIRPIPEAKPDFMISGWVGMKMTGNPLAIEWRKFSACVAL